jgi:transposase
VLEMTTNAFQLYDDLAPYVYSLTLVHPPHVKLITQARVMTDRIAAARLAGLHALGLLPPVWVPPAEVRDHRAVVAQRTKMTRLATQAKNRLHAVLHRHHIPTPEGNLFTPEKRAWWLSLPVTDLTRVRIQCDLDTLAFAQSQLDLLEKAIIQIATQDERVSLLIQLPGIGLLTAIALLAAMVEAAQSASNTHPHWMAELARLEPRLGRNKAIVAIARKLLVATWHVLVEGSADRFAEPAWVARKLLAHAERLGKASRPEGQTAAAYVRERLDCLGIGADLKTIQRGQRSIALPPSRLVQVKA